jgi:hypothetical protein
MCSSLATLGLIAVSQLCAAEGQITLSPSAERVQQFQRIEFAISGLGTYRNPFDLDEVQVDLLVRRPDGTRLTVPCFYYQEYEQSFEHGDREWLYPVGAAGWRARFTPLLPGTYEFVARVRDRSGVRSSQRRSVQVVPGRGKGFVTVGHGSRYLKFGDGTSFFAIGHNLAFLHYNQYLRDRRVIERVFEKLSAGGGNFTRVWAGAGDWALAIEWAKSGWTRTWLRSSPIGPVPGERGRTGVKLAGGSGAAVAFNPCAPVALRARTRYRLTICVVAREAYEMEVLRSGRRLIKLRGGPGRKEYETALNTGPNEWWLGRLSFRLVRPGTAWLTRISLREANGGPELLHEAYLDRPKMGYYNLLDAFILDKVVEAAERTGVYLQLCLLSNPVRDLYMARLRKPDSPEYSEAIEYGKRAFRYAIARWGYSTHVAVWEFFNEMNPGLPTDRFYAEVGSYIKELDYARRPVTTSAWHPNPRDWRHDSLDIANEHFYIREGLKKLDWKDEVAVVLSRARHVLELTPPRKPAMLAEFGLATRNWQKSRYMDQDKELLHFHNCLWSSALSGLAGTAMFWWWDTLDRMDCYKHYKPLAAFLAKVPFGQKELIPVSQEALLGPARDRLHLVGLQSKSGVYFWLANRESTWWRTLVEKAEPKAIRRAQVAFGGLHPGVYKVTWWDTWHGTVVKEATVHTTAGTLTLICPEFQKDIACRAQLHEASQ